MKIMKSAASASVLISIIFVAVGLLFFIIGCSAVADAKKFAEAAQETVALVTEVDSYTTRDSKGRRTKRYDVYVQYEIDGVQYIQELNGGSGTMREGRRLIVYYDPADPYDVRSSKGTGGQTFMVIFSLVFVGIGAGVGIVPAIKSAKKKELKETGVQAAALITDVVLDRSIKINHRSPYKAQCEVIDHVTGEKYLYSSEGVMTDIRHLQGQIVTVYYDPNDRSKYYVDLDSAEEDVLGGAPQIHDFR